ncbi:MAG TPA: hypothetical protein VII49_09830, partial [Rhizomicrobium sp.]
ANPAGNFALSANYDASGDGTYRNSPVPTTFTGVVQGLGNTISNITVVEVEGDNGVGGLFSEIGPAGAVENLDLAAVSVAAGGLVYWNKGLLFGDHVSGTVGSRSREDLSGGLAALSFGTIANCSSSASVVGGKKALEGGLVATFTGTISNSYATGSVTARNKDSPVGGLVGISYGGSILNSYAVGSVRGTFAGGLIGFNNNDALNVATSYSTGKIVGSAYPGGFIGYFGSGVPPTNNYWDTTTSGTDQGTGNDGNVPGITGLTTQQLQSGLPTGFDPTIWAEKPKINDGFPYLIANPPPKK